MGEDICIALPLLGQRLCAPLAQADTVAVAPRRNAEAAVLIPEGETGAPQPQCPPEGRAGDGLAADGQRGDIAGGRQGRFAEPLPGRGRVGGNAQPFRKELPRLRGRDCLLYTSPSPRD